MTETSSVQGSSQAISTEVKEPSAKNLSSASASGRVLRRPSSGTAHLCPLCLRPFHLRYQCPIYISGPIAVAKRLKELKADDPKKHDPSLFEELELYLKKAKKSARAALTNSSFTFPEGGLVSNKVGPASKPSPSPGIHPMPRGSRLSEVTVEGLGEGSSSEDSDQEGNVGESHFKPDPPPSDGTLELEKIMRGSHHSNLSLDEVISRSEAEEAEAEETAELEEDAPEEKTRRPRTSRRLSRRRRGSSSDEGIVASSSHGQAGASSDSESEAVPVTTGPPIVSRSASAHSSTMHSPRPISPTQDTGKQKSFQDMDMASSTELDMAGDNAFSDALAADHAAINLPSIKDQTTHTNEVIATSMNGRVVQEQPPSMPFTSTPSNPGASTPLAVPMPQDAMDVDSDDNLGPQSAETEIRTNPSSHNRGLDDDPIEPADDLIYPELEVDQVVDTGLASQDEHGPPPTQRLPPTPLTPRRSQLMKYRSGKLPQGLPGSQESGSSLSNIAKIVAAELDLVFPNPPEASEDVPGQSPSLHEADLDNSLQAHDTETQPPPANDVSGNAIGSVSANDDSVIELTSSPIVPPKRRPGRPRKSEQQQSQTLPPPRAISEPPRRRGRPPKLPTESLDQSATRPKRASSAAPSAPPTSALEALVKRRVRGPNKTVEEKAQEASEKANAKEERSRKRAEALRVKAENAAMKTNAKASSSNVLDMPQAFSTPQIPLRASTPQSLAQWETLQPSSPELEASLMIDQLQPDSLEEPVTPQSLLRNTRLRSKTAKRPPRASGFQHSQAIIADEDEIDDAPLFIPSDSVDMFPYSQFDSPQRVQTNGNLEHASNTESENEAAASILPPRFKPTSTTPFRRLQDVVLPTPRISAKQSTSKPAEAKNFYKKGLREEDEEDSSSDSSEGEKRSHIPFGKRAGHLLQLASKKTGLFSSAYRD